MTNRDRVNKGLELLRQGLAPYVEREVNSRITKGTIRPETWQRVAEHHSLKPLLQNTPISAWDLTPLFVLIHITWDDVFREALGYAERSWVNELREFRNRWAHQRDFSSEDVIRVLDTSERLLSAVSAAKEADEVRSMRLALARQVLDEQMRNERRKAGGSMLELAVAGGLKPWREVVQPHADVMQGRYQQAEFAADLALVFLGEGSDEYRKPQEFFRRTYLTEGLKRLLVNAMRRLSGQGGDPVVQLQTNFGGGKTHAMLALYHLFSGAHAADLVGIGELMGEAGIDRLPVVRRVVLVGTRLSPGRPQVKEDGTQVRTMWGELAWQLGGRQAYERIRPDDERATNPGDALRLLLRDYGPVLLLIDEWVAYARGLHDSQDLPGGSFETHFTFAQALTEAARGVENALLIVSLPASDKGDAPADDNEVGGLRGREALSRLHNIIGRMDSPWRPATPEESYRIVRRRLFEELTDAEAYKARDLTVRAFAELYEKHKSEFPAECSSSEYEERMREAYPIHPEIFERLYKVWSTSYKFQRTRGVLRLMANVIQSLWENDDRLPLILPASLPIGDHRVKTGLLRFLEDSWASIIDSEVDGPDALPRRIDSEQQNLGKVSACRRVARTIYLGSAPLVHSQHPGIEDRYIRLGCAFPGDNIAVFGDALRRLAAEATYLYHDNARYWYDTQPTVKREAALRAERLRQDPTRIQAELERRLREEARQKGLFKRIHILPSSHAEVADQPESGIVILSPEHPYQKGGDSPAEKAAQNILEYRGNTPRLYRNTLAFLAADEARYPDLDEALRRFLAWQSIVEESEILNLKPNQRRQAENQCNSADSTVKARLPEAYQWLLVPAQENPTEPITWKALKLSGGGALLVRASQRLAKEELLIENLGPTILRKCLDRIPLWRGHHVSVRQLVEDFAQYIYLRRLTDPSVLLKAIREGLALVTWQTETFAYADSYDENTQRYDGLRTGSNIALSEHTTGLIVRADIAYEQYIREQQQQQQSPGEALPNTTPTTTPTINYPPAVSAAPTPTPPARPKRLFATVHLNPNRLGIQVSRIEEEILVHLGKEPNANLVITLEIHADLPNGASEQLQRIIRENCNTLKFDNTRFEME